MYLNKIIVNDFKCYEGRHLFEFNKLNLIKGKNGSGKSSIALDSIFFVLFGYSETVLSDLPTRWLENPKCTVEVEVENCGDIWNIKRSIPSKLEITKNGIKDTHETNTGKQKLLNELFHNVEYFRKFRLLDVKQGINILEQGKVSLKKTLLSFNEGLFNDKRQSLLEKKREREIYNRNTASVSPHYPSEKRYDVICQGIGDVIDKLEQIDKEVRDIRNVGNKEYGKSIEVKSKISEERNKISKLKFMNSCPSCYQKVPQEHKDRILKETEDKISPLLEELKKYENAYKDSKDQESMYDGELKTLRQQQIRLTNARTKIETRLKQKEYKYTSQDVLIVSEALKELDKFVSSYITEWIKGLEPIINSITEKAGLAINFDLNHKDELDIIITKPDGTKYTYKDLSDGQRLILTIAFQGALLLQEGEEGLIIADEGFSSLDDDNLLHVLELFNDLPFQLVFILHRAPSMGERVTVIDLGV